VEALSREQLLDNVEKTAYDYELNYHGCSRCVLVSLGKHLGLGDDNILRAGTPLSGGIARTANTCGALLGGLMCIGLAFASSDTKDTESLFRTLDTSRRFYRVFEKEIGQVLCREIRIAKLGRFYDTVDPDEYEKFAAAGGHKACAEVASKAARLAAEFILDEREKAAKT
jgi:C_GCAxxG_C_C family probable redox protein